MNERAVLAETIMGPLAGMTITLIIALVIATYFYFRSRERQMMIEKGLTAEQMAELFKSKRNPYTWLKLGIIVVFSGIGIGMGVMADNAGLNEGLIPLSVITFIGLGFVGAFFISRKFEKEDATAEIK
jgi:uncharacterized membrane protein YkgB